MHSKTNPVCVHLSLLKAKFLEGKKHFKMWESKEKKNLETSVLKDNEIVSHISRYIQKLSQRSQRANYKCSNCGRERQTAIQYWVQSPFARYSQMDLENLRVKALVD